MNVGSERLMDRLCEIAPGKDAAIFERNGKYLGVVGTPEHVSQLATENRGKAYHIFPTRVPSTSELYACDIV